jgi:Uma2 family endonuclease
MVQLQPSSQSEVIYPDSDGQPMADNTKQFRWIVTVKENLEWLFANTPDVFIAGDLLWYPVEGDNKTRVAPDAMVVFGRAKGDRGSYKQWEEDNIAPQVVFEILSPGNTLTEMGQKLEFYDRYGVEEYYLYDPDRIDLSGWLRNENRLSTIENMQGWVSPSLGIRFEIHQHDLEIFDPNGQLFLTYVELGRLKQAAEARAEQEYQRAEQEYQRAEQAEAKIQELEAKLRELGHGA